MADTPDRDEKTEAPTDKRRRDAVQQGDVLQSRELGTALVVLAGAAWVALAGPWMVSSCEEVLRQGLNIDARDVAVFDPAGQAIRLLHAIALPLGALFLTTLVAAIGTPAMLGSLGFRWNAIAFKGGKLDPTKGIRRIFGLQGLVELGKSLIKVSLLGAVAWWLIRGRLAESIGLGRQDVAAALADMGHVFVVAVLVMGLALALIAGVDIPAQLIQRAARLRMTKQEVKEEHKNSEGSPEMKGARRRRQHELLSGGARKALPQATVVLTNPTHFAVALRYRPGFDAAPILLARGRGATAQAIRQLANDHAVPVLSYPQLTRAIYYTTREGSIIREDLYIAVATVLAFVFNLDRAMAEGVVQPKVDVPAGARFDEHGHVAAG